jgi:hypothetical protein
VILNFSQRGTFVNSITILGLGQHAIHLTSSTRPFEFVYIEKSFLFLFLFLFCKTKSQPINIPISHTQKNIYSN